MKLKIPARLNLGEIRRHVVEVIQAHPKVKPAALVCVALVGVYGISKLRETPLREVTSGKPTVEFHADRIFGSSAAAVSKEQDARLAKTTREYTDALMALKDRLEGIEKKVTVIEGNHGTTGAGPASAGTQQSRAPVGSNAASKTVDSSTPPLAGPSDGVTSNGGAQGSGRSSIGQPQPAMGLNPFGPSPLAGGRFAMPSFAVPTHGPASVSFPVQSIDSAKDGVTLPAGSYVRGKMLTGVAAPEGKPYPVLIELDYAHILPNRRRLDLSGCFVIAKAQGDLSTERLQMQATKMSCVARDGRMFEKDINGFVADDKDNNFAVTGEVVSKQDRVAVMAFLASVVEGVGKAVQQAQTKEVSTPLGGSQTILNGDQGKYVAAGGANDAAGMVASWYLKEAQSLLPTINVNSGVNVWIVLQDGVSLPSSYFKRLSNGGTRDDAYRYVTRLLE